MARKSRKNSALLKSIFQLPILTLQQSLSFLTIFDYSLTVFEIKDLVQESISKIAINKL
jgi:hypothetical protein